MFITIETAPICIAPFISFEQPSPMFTCWDRWTKAETLTSDQRNALGWSRNPRGSAGPFITADGEVYAELGADGMAHGGD